MKSVLLRSPLVVGAAKVLAAVAFAAALVLSFAPAATGPSPEAESVPCVAGTTGALGPGPGASCRAAAIGDAVPPASLMPDSLFNQNVSSWPVARDSTEIVNELNADWHSNYGNVGVTGRPLVWVPANQPMVPLSVQSGCNSFLGNTGTSAPIPAWAPTSGPTDYILTVYQPSSDSVWELWQAHPVTARTTADKGFGSIAKGWSACWGGKASLGTSSGVFPWPGGETATGISNLATEVSEADVLSGSIKHAIGLQVVNCTTYLYPADRGDCGSHPGYPAEGQWFRFAPSVSCSDYDTTPFENEVCIAGKQNGFVVVDHGGSDGIEADYATGSWTDEGNPGPMGSWHRNSNGGCCIFTGGGGPLEEAFENSPGNYVQEYQVIADLPWTQLQVIDPPQ